MLRAAALAALALAGCRSCPRPEPAPVVPAPIPEVQVLRVPEPCLEIEPPTASGFAPLPSDQTPAPCVACFVNPDAAVLDLYLSALESWANRAWARCKKRPAPTMEAP